jgi:hypothetical protein
MKIWLGLILLGLGLASSEAAAEAAAQSPPVDTQGANKLTQLKFLMDYTLFHIGAYITLSTLLVALLGLEGFKQRAMGMKYFLLVTLVCFMLAGICGGIVASNIPYFTSVDELSHKNIGPFFAVRAYPLIVWTSAEHVFFWIGVSSALIGVLTIIVFGSYTRRSAAATAERASQIGRACLEAVHHVEPNEAPTFRNMGEQLLQVGSDADARSEADAKARAEAKAKARARGQQPAG